MGLVPRTENPSELTMAITDIRQQTEVWVALRRDEGDQSGLSALAASGVIEALERYLEAIGDGVPEIESALVQMRALKEADTGYARYHIQGIATTREIAVSMCRDDTYLIGPLPVNVALAHDRTEWPGLHFPLKET